MAEGWLRGTSPRRGSKPPGLMGICGPIYIAAFLRLLKDAERGATVGLCSSSSLLQVPERFNSINTTRLFLPVPRTSAFRFKAVWTSLKICFLKLEFMAKSISSPSAHHSTQLRTSEVTDVDPSDQGQAHQFPAAFQRARRARPPRVSIHNLAACIPPIESELVPDSELIQLKMKVNIQSNETLKFKVGVEVESQEVVGSKVMKLRVTVSKLKAVRMLHPEELDTSRLLSLADVCYEHGLALANVAAPHDR